MNVQPSKRTVHAGQSPGAFYLTRGSQFVASLIVSGIQAHFLLQLALGKYGIPYLFIVIMASAIISLATLLITSVFYCCHKLNVTVSAVFNGILTLLWAFSFGALAKAIHSTLSLSCTVEKWTNKDGVKTCQEYKVLFTFTFIAVIASIASFAHDVATIKQQKSRGAYKLAEDKKPLHLNSSSVSVGGAWEIPPSYGGSGAQSQNDFELQPRPIGPLAPTTYDNPVHNTATYDAASTYSGPVTYTPYSAGSTPAPPYQNPSYASTGTESTLYQVPPSHYPNAGVPYHDAGSSYGYVAHPTAYQDPVSASQGPTTGYQSPADTYQAPTSGFQNPVAGFTNQRNNGYQVPSEQLQYADTAYHR